MLALLLALSSSAAPTTTSIDVEEEVVLYASFEHEKNPSKQAKLRQRAFEQAFEVAKKAALSRALEQAVASLQPGPAGSSLMARELINDRAAQLVTASDLNETHTDNRLKLSLKANVQLDALEKELGDIRAKMTLLGQKRVLLAVGEIAIEPNGERAKEGSRHVMSAVLARMLKSDGWTIYDGAGRFETGDPSREEIQRVAQELGVDQILTGLATYRRLPPSKNGGLIGERNAQGEQIMFFVSADYALELVDAGSWVPRATVAGTLDPRRIRGVQLGGGYASTEVSFTEASAPVVAAQLREKMLAMLTELATNGLEISVMLTRVDRGQVASFEKVLRTLDGVKDVVRRGDAEDGQQGFEVRFVGTAQELAKQLTRAKGHRLAVTGVKKALIELSPR